MACSRYDFYSRAFERLSRTNDQTSNDVLGDGPRGIVSSGRKVLG